MEMPKMDALLRVAAQEQAETWAMRRRLRDYAKVGRALFFQRIAIYSAAILLAGAYYSWTVAAWYYAGVWICEAFDFLVFRGILKRRTWTEQDIRRAMAQIYAGTLLSAVTISLFCVSVAAYQPPGSGHFLPLFLLVSASIFAAMNNHHFLKVLGLRLAIYVSTILFIPARAVWVESPPLNSEIWLNLFTVLFVLAFIVELSRSFLLGYSRYLASRKELEDEHKRTKAAYEAKTRFLATVSHELRTPLTSIRGALEMINSGMLGAPPEKMGRLLEVAGRNSQRLGDLVGDLLFLQSSEVGKIDFNFDRLDFGQLVQETTYRFQPYAEKLGVTLRTDAPEEAFWITCDRKRMDQVLTNLLSNAAKFSNRQGVIDIAVQWHGNGIRMTVQDRGIGIPEGAQTDVFQEFTQLDNNDDRKFGGTGLGLSISKRIVEAHGGEIGYTSVLGEGTTFHVDLPQDRPVQITLPGVLG